MVLLFPDEIVLETKASRFNTGFTVVTFEQCFFVLPQRKVCNGTRLLSRAEHSQ